MRLLFKSFGQRIIFKVKMAVSATPRHIKELLSSFLRDANPILSTRCEENTTEGSKSNSGNDAPSKDSACQPRSHKAFVQRVETFTPFTWFGKPSNLSPLQCAQFGWTNSDVDMLRCVSCKSQLDGTLSSDWDLDMYNKTCSRLKQELISGHSTICPWADNHSPDSFLMILPLKSESEWSQYFTEVCQNVMDHGERIPQLSEETLEKLECLNDPVMEKLVEISGVLDRAWTCDEVDVQEAAKIAAVIALTGWSNSSMGSSACPTLSCSGCQREVGLWNFLNITGKALSLPEISYNEMYSAPPSCKGESDSEDQPTLCTKEDNAAEGQPPTVAVSEDSVSECEKTSCCSGEGITTEEIPPVADTEQPQGEQAREEKCPDEKNNVEKSDSECSLLVQNEEMPEDENTERPEESMECAHKDAPEEDDQTVPEIISENDSCSEVSNEEAAENKASSNDIVVVENKDCETEENSPDQDQMSDKKNPLRNLQTKGAITPIIIVEKDYSGAETDSNFSIPSDIEDRTIVPGEVTCRDLLSLKRLYSRQESHVDTEAGSMCVEVGDEDIDARLKYIEEDLKLQADGEPQRKRMRVEQPVVSQTPFDPLAEHRSWCPWIIPVEGNSVPPSTSVVTSQRSPEYSISPGWKILLQNLIPSLNANRTQSLKETPPSDAWKSVRRLLNKCSAVKPSPSKPSPTK